MSKVISFVTQKGGAGKTTLLMLTASAIHNRTNNKVLVIDSDPQLSVKTIYKNEKNSASYDVFAFNWNQPNPEINFEKVLILARQKYDVVLMDLPGNIKSQELFFSILESDILIVPIVASTLDVNATLSFLKRIPEYQQKRKTDKKPLEVFGVINKKDNTIEYRLLRQISELKQVRLFYSSLSSLVRYKRHISTFKDITDPDNRDDEFNQYFDEFRTHCYI